MPAVSFLPFLQQVPFATRIITATLVLLSLAALLLSTFVRQNTDGGIPSVNLPWLVMVPGKSYWYPWTLLTAGWVELSLIGVSLGTGGVVLGACLVVGRDHCSLDFFLPFLLAPHLLYRHHL